jgi:hypothetical protein
MLQLVAPSHGGPQPVPPPPMMIYPEGTLVIADGGSVSSGPLTNQGTIIDNSYLSISTTTFDNSGRFDAPYGFIATDFTNRGRLGVQYGHGGDTSTFTQTPSGTLDVTLNPAEDYFAALFTKSATLAGNLQVELAGGFTPHRGDRFLLVGGLEPINVSGTFANADPYFTSDGITYRVDYTGGVTLTTLTTAQGDSNFDGRVDFADLLILAQHYGLKSGQDYATGDFNYDGGVAFDDLLVLAQNYGGGNDGATTAVPEPASLAIASWGVVAFTRRSRQTRLTTQRV